MAKTPQQLEANRIYMAAYRKKYPDKVKAAAAKQDKERLNRLARERHKTDPLNRLIMWTKKSAKKRGLEHTIKRSDIVERVLCPVFKVPFIVGDNNWAMSIDRIDSSKGYVPGNVQIISRLANRMKDCATEEQLEQFADWIQNG